MIVDGKKIAARMKEEVLSLAAGGPRKSLGIFYVGNDPVIESYIARKEKFGKDAGIDVEVVRFPEDVSEESLLESIENESAKFDGVIIQLPLPPHLDKKTILNSIAVEKDVDVLSDVSVEQFAHWQTMKLPPVVRAVAEIVKEYDIELNGKDILVLGMGQLVGKPVSIWLQREGYVVKTVEKDTVGIPELLNSADVIISGTGVPWMIKPEMIKDEVVLIDAGTSSEGGEIRGDIDPACGNKAKLFSTVPGGVGPITVASIFKNLFL